MGGLAGGGEKGASKRGGGLAERAKNFAEGGRAAGEGPCQGRIYLGERLRALLVPEGWRRARSVCACYIPPGNDADEDERTTLQRRRDTSFFLFAARPARKERASSIGEEGLRGGGAIYPTPLLLYGLPL